MSVSMDEAGADNGVAAVNGFCDIFRFWDVICDFDNDVVSNQDFSTRCNDLVVLLMQENSS